MQSIVDVSTLFSFPCGQYTDGTWFAVYNGTTYTHSTVAGLFDIIRPLIDTLAPVG